MESPIHLLLLLFFSSVVLFSNDYPHFPVQELREIEARSGVIAKNRTLHYQLILNDLRSKKQNDQLKLVNYNLNQLIARTDIQTKKIQDYWATPKEFLITGKGDCEDYAIIKYYSLIKLGFDKNKLYLTMVKELFNGRDHMVLSYFPNLNAQPLVLDNLSFKVLPLNKRTDLKANYFINNNGVFSLNNNHLKKEGLYNKKFVRLTEQVAQEELHTQILQACN